MRFITVIVDEVTTNGVADPGRLFESPCTDHAPIGPDFFFPHADGDTIIEVLHDIGPTPPPPR